jgi:hypothetical protein
MRHAFSWDKVCENPHVGGNELFIRILTEESLKKCDQCTTGNCTHGAAKAVLQHRVKQGRHWSWDNEATRGTNYRGFNMDQLLTLLLERAGESKGNLFYWPAQCVLGAKRIHEHDPDCPECRRLEEQRRERMQ